MIVSEFLSNKLVTRLNHGFIDGKEVIKNKSYGNIKADASLPDLMAVGVAITGLQLPALEEVRRIQEDLIFDDGQ
ncbi:DUF1659 domain-containing protein [uncultured Acetobacterium sp.]|uniref:DUF1659 domain-containing protein n=1 Tax=uncultured Acetobacterium sp. TaxID=217139 RepID=UPI0025DE793D|nr:DUF1659 domain-containing protein [uncultured Acetobacterium sp.]